MEPWGPHLVSSFCLHGLNEGMSAWPHSLPLLGIKSPRRESHWSSVHPGLNQGSGRCSSKRASGVLFPPTPRETQFSCVFRKLRLYSVAGREDRNAP